MNPEEKNKLNNLPEPEMLDVINDAPSEGGFSVGDVVEKKEKTTEEQKRNLAHLPSSRGTIIGLIVVALVIAVNVTVVFLVVKSQDDQKKEEEKRSVTLSDKTLNGLGVSRNPVGNDQTLLTINPETTFKNKVSISGDTTVAGKLTLNNALSTTGVTAGDGTFTKLQAGDTQVQQLNVNGDGTITNLNLRKDLQVAGLTRIQGQLTVNQLATINNNLNVAGNVSIGGSLSVRNFQVGQLTVGGHLLSTGGAPGVSSGGAVGSNGTVSISGNDTAGTVAVNTGTGAGNGMLAQVSFREKYGNTPRIVVTPVGRAVPGLYVNRTATGFSINVEGAMSYGGFAFDYVVAQ